MAFAIFAFLNLMFLFNSVLQGWNEHVTLPRARQFVERAGCQMIGS